MLLSMGGAVGLDVEQTGNLPLKTVEPLHHLGRQLLALLLCEFRLEVPRDDMTNHGEHPFCCKIFMALL